MRRLLPVCALGLLALAVRVSTALAAPGGGSSGFGGGGGGGGGGFGGGGGGGTGSGSGGSPFVLILIALAVALFVGLGALRTWRYRQQRSRRARRVELASAEAAQDDAYFAADEVKQSAAALQRELIDAWSARDRDRLRARLGAELMVEWARRLDDFDRKGWHNVCELQGTQHVEYLGLVNRDDDRDDRVVVRMTATMRDIVVDRRGQVITRKDEGSETVALAEYWTLGRDNGGWRLLSIEQDTEGRHILDAPIVASPWSDEGRLHDAAVTELAVADAAPNVAEVADLDFDGDARAAALDLSNADGRFAPAVLEAAARRAVAAWAEAVDGSDAPLEAVATPAAVQELLYGGDASRDTRLVVRGPRLRAVRIVTLDARRVPPAMTVEADVAGRRYVEDRDTAAVLHGSKERETTFTERWTMTLDGGADAPWRISAA